MLTNTMDLPQPFVDAAGGKHQYKPNRYSVTEILGGQCEAVLKRRHQREVVEDVSDRVWAIFGTAVHKVLQESKASDKQHQEEWLKVDVGEGYELSGIFDLYDEATGTVTDWKVTSVWTVQFADYEKWRMQTLIYCWMLRRHGYDARRGEIVAILRDHNMRKARTDADYPSGPVVKVCWEFSSEDFSEAEKHIREWFEEVARMEKLPDSELAQCSLESRWHKPDTWAVMKAGRKKAVRVFDDENKAVELLNKLKESDKGYNLEFRRGEDTRCASYCSVAEFCPHTDKAK